MDEKTEVWREDVKWTGEDRGGMWFAPCPMTSHGAVLSEACNDARSACWNPGELLPLTSLSPSQFCLPELRLNEAQVPTLLLKNNNIKYSFKNHYLMNKWIDKTKRGRFDTLAA